MRATWIYLDSISPFTFVLFALTLGLAPFTPEPHLVEKIRMLVSGTLSKPIDIFDLLMHGTPWVLVFIKVARMVKLRSL